MISIKSFARSAPRAVSRLTASAIRTPSTRRPTASLLQSTWKPTTAARCSTAFSTSTQRMSAAEVEAEGDEELIAKIDSELQLESEMKASEEIPTSVEEYLKNGPFELVDTPGVEEVVLTRQFGNEKITVTFSIADINSMDPESDYSQDRAMSDEEDSETKQAEESPEEDGEGEAEQDPSFPARLTVVVEKSGKGALAVDTVAQDGMILVENVSFFPDASHAHAKTPAKMHERQDMYVGPPFGNLDEDLQVLLERYLDERGINTALAIFVPDYIDMKEQKEYVRWLGNVKDFVEA